MSSGHLRLVRDKESPEPEGWIVNEKKPGACNHLEVVVDAELRRAECGRCGEVLDPIQCLINMARREKKIVSQIASLRQLEAFNRERSAAARKTHDLKERRHLVATFGEAAALRDFICRSGESYTVDDKRIWINWYDHKPTGRCIGVEKRARAFWCYDGTRKFRINEEEAKAIAATPAPEKGLPHAP